MYTKAGLILSSTQSVESRQICRFLHLKIQECCAFFYRLILTKSLLRQNVGFAGKQVSTDLMIPSPNVHRQGESGFQSVRRSLTEDVWPSFYHIGFTEAKTHWKHPTHLLLKKEKKEATTSTKSSLTCLLSFSFDCGASDESFFLIKEQIINSPEDVSSNFFNPLIIIILITPLYEMTRVVSAVTNINSICNSMAGQNKTLWGLRTKDGLRGERGLTPTPQRVIHFLREQMAWSQFPVIYF